MTRRIAILGMLLFLMFGQAPARAADLAPGLSPELFKTLDAMVDHAMTAYNAGDSKKFYADYAKAMQGIATDQAFKTLYTDMYKKQYGNFKSKKLNTTRSTVPGPVALLVYDVTMDKGTAVLSVNLMKEGNDYKFQQIQFNKQ